MKPFRLPDGFLLGCATAATQIEGGDRNNSWFDWCRRGKIRDGSSVLRADDHWNRIPEDMELLSALNQRVYRLGLEWSRIEPRRGEFDPEAVAQYRRELRLLRAAGIRPLVTLHHFSNPLWFEEEGAFENEHSVADFERYVRYVVGQLGDLVSEFVTINEPNVYVANGYVSGSWPPGKRDLRLAARVYENLARCHIAAYRAIHELRAGAAEPSRVGIAHHMRVFVPYHRFNPLDRLAAGFMSRYLQEGIIRLMVNGKMNFPAGLFAPKIAKGRYCDFLGFNYYTRSAVRFRGFRDAVRPGAAVNDLGWEIWPDGLSRLCRQYSKKFPMPIWITENGVCDNRDTLRAEFLCNHLEKICEAAAQGARVERYYHWSLLDNFEWLEGESARFGLVHVDYETQRRTVKRSGALYAAICENGGLTQAMIDDFLRNSVKGPAEDEAG